MKSFINPHQATKYKVIEDLQKIGYEFILSIGELSENAIGSNCGQFVNRYLNSQNSMDDAYDIKPIDIKNK